MLAGGIERLSALQEKLYADGRWSVLIVLQAMDAAGKDSLIEHVMSGINPQGCEVHAFKAPSEEELKHDFLWRVAQRLPRKGHIGIFNPFALRGGVDGARASGIAQGAEVAAASGRQGTLAAALQGHPRLRRASGAQRHAGPESSSSTCRATSSASASSTASKSRANAGSSRWATSPRRKLWPKYMDAYEDAIRETSRPEAPWFVVPADNKWFTRLVVAGTIVDAMERLDLEFPKGRRQGPE